MKLSDIKPLVESVTFNAVEEKTWKDGSKYFSGNYTKVEKECWVCDGTKVQDGMPCEYCHGKGTYIDDECEGPELNVANANAHLICNMLGAEWDESGVVYNKDIPAALQTLIKIKNSKGGVDAHTRPDEVIGGEMRVNRDGPVPSIGRGATIHSMGVDASRVMAYVDKLIELFKYAKDHNMHVSWA